ncbi:MAG: hypothetical protein WBQ72_09230 [Terriglobales bacterium]|jgi:hypothetical protein
MENDYDTEKAKRDHEAAQRAAWQEHRASVTDDTRERAAEIAGAIFPPKI